MFAIGFVALLIAARVKVHIMVANYLEKRHTDFGNGGFIIRVEIELIKNQIAKGYAMYRLIAECCDNFFGLRCRNCIQLFGIFLIEYLSITSNNKCVLIITCFQWFKYKVNLLFFFGRGQSLYKSWLYRCYVETDNPMAI